MDKKLKIGAIGTLVVLLVALVVVAMYGVKGLLVVIMAASVVSLFSFEWFREILWGLGELLARGARLGWHAVSVVADRLAQLSERSADAMSGRRAVLRDCRTSKRDIPSWYELGNEDGHGYEGISIFDREVEDAPAPA